MLVLNKHRKWHTKIKHEQFEGTTQLEYENSPSYASIRKQVHTSGLPLKGQRPLKCDRKNKHTLHSWFKWSSFILYQIYVGKLIMCSCLCDHFNFHPIGCQWKKSGLVIKGCYQEQKGHNSQYKLFDLSGNLDCIH